MMMEEEVSIDNDWDIAKKLMLQEVSFKEVKDFILRNKVNLDKNSQGKSLLYYVILTYNENEIEEFLKLKKII